MNSNILQQREIMRLESFGGNFMHPFDTGCLKESEVYFYTPGDQARRTFFYPLCAGHYFCSPDYRVQRNNYDSFLFIYVKKGGGFLTIQAAPADHQEHDSSRAAAAVHEEDQTWKTYEFHEGDIISVDCYQPHIYGTAMDSEILWLHFDGSSSREYIQMIHSVSGPVCHLKNTLEVEKTLQKIMTMISSQKNINDAACSLCILQLLTYALPSEQGSGPENRSTGIIEDTISYISSHIGEELPLKLLAGRAGLSPFYFTRLFKKETGYTPHNYIIQSRINIAKFYLKSSSYSIKEICFNSGFPNESSFCSTFKKICNMTPSEYKAGSDPAK